MKFLLDMNLPPRWVGTLSKRGIEAIHWIECGDPTASDVTVMKFASNHNMIVISHDLDFSAILASSGARGPSVIQLRTMDISDETCIPILASAIHECNNELLTGSILSLDTYHRRVRILPIR